MVKQSYLKHIDMKPKACMLDLFTRYGRACEQMHFDSIASAVRFAKESFAFTYKVYVDGKVVRKGFC